MSAIAEFLDQKLKEWHPETARRVAEQVQEIIARADGESVPPSSQGGAHPSRKDDPLFSDQVIWQGPVPANLAANHDAYLYGGKR